MQLHRTHTHTHTTLSLTCAHTRTHPHNTVKWAVFSVLACWHQMCISADLSLRLCLLLPVCVCVCVCVCVSLSLSLSRTHTHTHKYTRTHSHTTYVVCACVCPRACVWRTVPQINSLSSDMWFRAHADGVLFAIETGCEISGVVATMLCTVINGVCRLSYIMAAENPTRPRSLDPRNTWSRRRNRNPQPVEIP